MRFNSKLLTFSNTKTVKGLKRGYATAILHLAPFRLSGHNLCPNASPGCVSGCLNAAGRGRFEPIAKARLARSQAFLKDRMGFLAELEKEIGRFKLWARKRGFVPAVRLNGTSDLPFERFARHLFEQFFDVQFYDYTKSPERMESFLKGKTPPNYHLTFSRSEKNEAEAVRILHAGGNVACVFRGALPKRWQGKPVIDGDDTDLRFVDAPGVVVGLKAKGKAKKDLTGFVID